MVMESAGKLICPCVGSRGLIIGQEVGVLAIHTTSYEGVRFAGRLAKWMYTQLITTHKDRSSPKTISYQAENLNNTIHHRFHLTSTHKSNQTHGVVFIHESDRSPHTSIYIKPAMRSSHLPSCKPKPISIRSPKSAELCNSTKKPNPNHRSLYNYLLPIPIPVKSYTANHH
jgi:hypothetical protein